MVEAAVMIVKKLLKRSQDLYLAILEWRNTPTAELGTSPCQQLFVRRTRSVIPVTASKLVPSFPLEMWEKAEKNTGVQNKVWKLYRYWLRMSRQGRSSKREGLPR